MSPSPQKPREQTILLLLTSSGVFRRQGPGLIPAKRCLAAGLVLNVAILAGLGCRVTDIPIWADSKAMPAGEGDFEEIKDIPYASTLKFEPFRHKLDLILPSNKKGYPVVVLVHGGAWIMGDNRCCGLYTAVGRFLASQGIGVVLPNYRLSPGVKHPDHIKDLAKVMSWTRENIFRFGGNPNELFLLGHSAGGHLVSLLTTDESYLNAEGMRTADVKGVISVSGVYSIPPGNMEFTFGGTGPFAFRADQVFPIRGDSPLDTPGKFGGIPTKLDIFAPAFGSNERERLQASPINFVRSGLPPFLILIADKDLPLLPGMAEEFHQALLHKGCDARLLRIRRRNHNSLMFTAIRSEDPAAAAILEFIRNHDK
jgi:acetyl esterase/lipase